MMAVLDTYPTSVIRGVSRLGLRLRHAPLRVALLALVTIKAVRAGQAVVVGAAGSRNPDPQPRNNVAIATITVKR
jgi:hypothetical protein